MAASPPSLSSQIRDLENCVGVPLLVRDKRKVALTAAGECFSGRAGNPRTSGKCQITAENCSGRQTINHWLCAIGGSEFTAKSITDVSSRQPDTLIELVSLITTQQEEKIRRGELDVGLMRHPVYSPEIDYLELFDEPLVVVLPVDHP
ncbi:LysR substrate-binding domain-containing protein [Escherichia coli]